MIITSQALLRTDTQSCQTQICRCAEGVSINTTWMAGSSSLHTDRYGLSKSSGGKSEPAPDQMVQTLCYKLCVVCETSCIYVILAFELQVLSNHCTYFNHVFAPHQDVQMQMK